MSEFRSKPNGERYPISNSNNRRGSTPKFSKKLPSATTDNTLRFLKEQYTAPAVIRRLKYQFKTREDVLFKLNSLGKLQLEARMSNAGVPEYTRERVFEYFGFDKIV